MVQSSHHHPDRLPPCSEDAERAVLGSILLDASRVMDLCRERHIQREAFYVPAHQIIWDACDRISRSGRSPDILLVTQTIDDDGDLPNIGGATALDRLIDSTPTATHADYYINIVVEKWTLRRVVAAVREAEAAAYEAASEDGEAERVRSEAEFALTQIRREPMERRTKGQILLDQCARWRKARETGTAGINTGIRLLDAHWGGLMDQGFYLLTGTRKSCKTTLAKQIAMHTAENGIPTAFFTLEISEDMLIGSIAAIWSKQSVYYLNSGNHVRSHVELVEAMADRVDRMALFHDDRPQTALSLWSACRRLVSKEGVKLIIVDYLQKIADGDNKFRNIEERVTHQSNTLCAIAKTLKIPVLAVAAENTAGAVRGSAMAEYDATAIVRLTRNDPPDDYVFIDFVTSRWSPAAGRETMRLVDGVLEDVAVPEESKDDFGFMGTTEA